MALTKFKLGDLIELVDERNSEGKYSFSDVRGMTITKEIIPTKADVSKTDLSNFIIVNLGEFIFNPRTHGKKIGFGYNNTGNSFIISWNNIAFRIKKSMSNTVLSEYLFLHFNRSEWDREACFHSWGSSTEVFTWDSLCGMEFYLPPLEIQEKFVAVYNSMVANQKIYESGLEDLKLVCDGYIDKIKHTAKKVPLGNLITEIDDRNVDGKYKVAHGINVTKNFMPTVASSEDLRRYKIVQKNNFVCSLMRVGRDRIIPVAFHDTEPPLIVSPAYVVWGLNSSEVTPQYLYMWLSRGETDRRAVFMSDTSIRSGVEKKRFFEIEIPIPEMKYQKSIVEIYEVLQTRKKILEQLKIQIKRICPILIKGSLDEGEMC